MIIREFFYRVNRGALELELIEMESNLQSIEHMRTWIIAMINNN